MQCHDVLDLLCIVQVGRCVLATSAGSLVVINVSNQVNHHTAYYMYTNARVSWFSFNGLSAALGHFK